MIIADNTHLSNELILGVMGTLCTLLGAFFGALFSYLSLNKQFSHSIKKLRIDRTFDSYENLLELIIAAQSYKTSTVDNIKYTFSAVLFEEKNFRVWYGAFLKAFHQKKYLLDSQSLASCEKLSSFIVAFLNKYPWFRADRSDSEKFPTLSELIDCHKEYFGLLSEAYDSLKNFLLHDIEKV
ncbi:MAG: hypothetical protein ABSC53_06290 [Bacteroidota bacterium]